MRGIYIQFKVIHALIMRELQTRFGRENIGFLWFVGEPALFCLGVTVVWTAIRPPYENGLPMTAIVLTGYVPLTMWRHCIARSVAAFMANGSLMYHRQVTTTDIIISRMIIEILGAICAGIVIYFGAYFLGYISAPEKYDMLIIGLIYQSVFCFSSGLLIAPLSEKSDILEKALGIISYLSIPLSGAFVMVDWIPEKYRWILMSSPSVEGVEMIRDGQFGYHAHAHYNIIYSTWINIVLLIIGMKLTFDARKSIRLE
ncbi:ABC transporter permease [Acidomonas methanolica]|uniref:ABC transporter permease n=2 Tax=Acidomonas methanolica TaxID=437 RepID=UPI0009DD653D|nr:ABC transporter permease [Acidomonas methanolica]MBU2653828.1 ABC transporter permease [Acidomonas methanolica]TCS21417.1 capsular polysaccharide transport system permease protein [Acidomonas methanolica]